MSTTVEVHHDRHICSGAYASNVKGIYSSACSHIMDCSEFIWDIYTDIVVIYSHKVIGICGIYMAFEGHICCRHIYGYEMLNKVVVCCYFLLVCAVMWGLHVHYMIFAVGCDRYICLIHMPVMWKVCIQCLWWHCWLQWVYEVYILT